MYYLLDNSVEPHDRHLHIFLNVNDDKEVQPIRWKEELIGTFQWLQTGEARDWFAPGTCEQQQQARCIT